MGTRSRLMSVVLAAATAAAGPATQPTTAPSTSLSAPQVTVSDAGTVELHVNDADLLEVLRMLSLQAQRNIVATKGVSGTVTANLYNVTLQQALDAILASNGMVYRERANFIYVYTPAELAALDRAARPMAPPAVFHLCYVGVGDVLAMVKPLLSPDGSVTGTKESAKGIDTSGASGGSTGSTGIDTGGNSYAGADLLVVTDYAENVDKIRQLLAQVDRRPQQVLVEATIMAATLTDQNSLGIDLSFLGGVDFNSLLGSGSSQGSLLNANALNGTATGGGANGPFAAKGYAGFSSGGGGLQVGVLHKNLGVFINALESVSNTTILANPKVLALDKQAAKVHVGSSFGYQTTTVTQTTSTQTVQFIETGTILSFRPFVGSDGHVRMEIHPEDSTGGLNASNLPYTTTTEITTNVDVKDGNTIVIGGLFREQTDRTRGQVPLLGSIPYLGALFRDQSDDSTRQEIIILLTPHIIKDDSAYAAVSAEAMRAAEAYRVGARKGLMFFGTERLAEAAYEDARAELAKPHPDRGLALWHLDLATNMNPSFLEAVQLKEHETGQRVTDVDNSAVRDFVRQSMLADPPRP
jgi:type IV pilus assembly protein PilQ